MPWGAFHVFRPDVPAVLLYCDNDAVPDCETIFRPILKT